MNAMPKKLLKKVRGLKSIELSCIDLFITSILLNFQNEMTLSVFQKVVVTFIKMTFKKLSPRE